MSGRRRLPASLRYEQRLVARDEWRDGGSVYGRQCRYDATTTYLPRAGFDVLITVFYWPPRTHWLNPDHFAVMDSAVARQDQAGDSAP